jgi:Mg2+ and Co2+ transporter CorA
MTTNNTRTSDDLVMLLRDRDEDSPDMLLRSAADELERLRDELKKAQQLAVRQANELRRLATSKSQQKRYEAQQS